MAIRGVSSSGAAPNKSKRSRRRRKRKMEKEGTDDETDETLKRKRRDGYQDKGVGVDVIGRDRRRYIPD